MSFGLTTRESDLFMLRYEVLRLDARPELAEEILRLHRLSWPEFLRHDNSVEWNLLYTAFSQFQLLLCEPSGAVIAAGQTVPFFWDGAPASLPADFDNLMKTAVQCRQEGPCATALCAVAAMVAPGHRGQGFSTLILREMAKLGASNHLGDLVAPVRPTLKQQYPLTPMERYVEWKRADGTPFDPWLRVHWRLGGTRLHVAAEMLAIKGSVPDWEKWTGMEFSESGQYIVPGALQPVSINRESDVGCYHDPNVWFRHPLTVELLDGA